MKDLVEGHFSPIFVAPNCHLVNRDFYIHRIWLPARNMREKIGGRSMWVTAMELIYDFQERLFFPSGKPYHCPHIDQIFGYDNRWMDTFLEADASGKAPKTYARYHERLRLIELYCRLAGGIDWSAPAPPDGTLHGNLPIPQKLRGHSNVRDADKYQTPPHTGGGRALAEILGSEDSPKPGSIRDLKSRISHIEQHLQDEIENKHSARDALTREIFAAKNRIRKFYENLKKSVETRLSIVSTGEFNVTINASFVLATTFAEGFFEQVRQNVKGPFYRDGLSVLGRVLSEVDWNDIETILKLLKTIIDQMKGEDIAAQTKEVRRFYDFLYSLEYIDARYELRLGGKNLNQLSPGEKGLLLLVFYLHLDKEKTPLIIDQPEDNLDNDSIFSVLASCIREAKTMRQVILVTHNPNLAVGADAEEILYVRLEKHKGYKFSYESGSIENPRINDCIVKVLEGSKPAFVQRRLKYQIA